MIFIQAKMAFIQENQGKMVLVQEKNTFIEKNNIHSSKNGI